MPSERVVEAPDANGALREVRITNPDKPVWPAAGITKSHLADYHLAVASQFLEHNGDRPVALQRFRGGVTGEEFFSKNPPKGMPDWMRAVDVVFPSARSHPMIVLDSPAAVLWCVQMSTVTFHPWPVRSDDNDRPDELRLDLDPQPGRGFVDAVEAAFVLRDLLAQLGLTAYAKTSGNRGVHIFAPLVRDLEFLDVRHAAIWIGRELQRRLPDLVTMAWWKELRGSTVFVDFNQTNRDRTLAGAYSPRPLPHAPVSMPVTWEQLADVDPASYTVLTVPQILAERGDAWAGMAEAAAPIGGALALWERDCAAGLGEEPFPPDYPKMPGEPPRVQPSRINLDNWD